MTSSPIERADIVAQTFIGLLAIIRIFGDLDRSSVVSGSNVMPKKIQNISGIS